MKWLNEIFKDLNLENSKEVISAIKKGVGENFVPKADFNSKLEEIKTLNTSITERDTQLEELKKIDHDGLQKQIETLQQENLAETEKYKSKVEELRLENAIKLKFTGQTHDPDLATREFRAEFGSLKADEEGKVLGLDEAFTQFKEKKAFLFMPEDNAGFQPKFGKAPPEGGDPGEDAIAAAFGVSKKE